MFYCFKVNEEYCNYFRFFWYEGNDFYKFFVEYCMCVYVFGNIVFLVIVIYGFRFVVNYSCFGFDVSDFVCKDFYVDDGFKLLFIVE